jgi:hypothetical protein
MVQDRTLAHETDNERLDENGRDAVVRPEDLRIEARRDRMRKLGMVSIVFLLIACAMSTGAYGQVDETQKKVLSGLVNVYVVVERIKPELERDGLYSSTIQSDAEMKLKMAGLQVMPKEDVAAEIPCLVLQVNGLKCSGGYIYDTRVFLREPVVVLRKRTRIEGTTLRIRSQFGFTPRLSDIREEAKEAIDDFIKAWQEANPK